MVGEALAERIVVEPADACPVLLHQADCGGMKEPVQTPISLTFFVNAFFRKSIVSWSTEGPLLSRPPTTTMYWNWRGSTKSDVGATLTPQLDVIRCRATKYLPVGQHTDRPVEFAARQPQRVDEEGKRGERERLGEHETDLQPIDRHALIQRFHVTPPRFRVHLIWKNAAIANVGQRV